MNLLTAGAPWWAVLLLSLPTAAAVIIRSVFPQNSADRLAWWRDRRLHRERLARTRHGPGARPLHGRSRPRGAAGHGPPRSGPGSSPATPSGSGNALRLSARIAFVYRSTASAIDGSIRLEGATAWCAARASL